MNFLRGLLEKVNRNDIVFDPAEKRILPMGTYLTPDQKGTECDRFASVRRRLKELDDCCLRDRIEVHGENLMLRDKRKPVLEIRFMSVSKDGTRRGRRKVESVRFMNPKMIEDMLLLLEAYRNGDEWVQMPKDWTKRFQNRKGKETSPARRFKDRFVEMQRLRDGYWTGLARISDSGFKSLR